MKEGCFVAACFGLSSTPLVVKFLSKQEAEGKKKKFNLKNSSKQRSMRNLEKKLIRLMKVLDQLIYFIDKTCF